MQLPVQEKFLSTKAELDDQLAILLGGRVAEEIVFGDISSGASNDLERASEIARGMVCQLGMSEQLGPLTYGRRQQAQYLGVEYGEERNYSEETARMIDAEVRLLVEDARNRAHTVLTEERSQLNALAAALEHHEVLNGDEVAEVIGGVAGGTPAST
jgi:cell division protease FtsH